MRWPRHDLDAIAFDDRIRQQLVRRFRCELACVFRPVRVDVELEVLPLADILHGGVSKRVKRVGDGFSLRVEDRWLESDEHARTHQADLPAGARNRPLRLLNVLENALKDVVDVLQLLAEVEGALDVGTATARASRPHRRAAASLKSRFS